MTLVHKLASLVKADLDQVISVYEAKDQSNASPIVGPCTLKAALLQHYDITSNIRKPQLRVLAQYAEDEEEKKMLMKLSSDDPDEQAIYEKAIIAECRYIDAKLCVLGS